MKLHQATAEIFIGDGAALDEALARTTHLAICAHQDDIEILAVHGILECFHHPGRGFSGVVVTDGAGSARAFEYADATDEQMKAVRRIEQKKAAFVGEYAAQFLLDHPSSFVRDPGETVVVDELLQVLTASRPEIVYTHNLCDKHETHVAVALRTITALRRLPVGLRPRQVIGCEVWRDLDWLPDPVKVSLDVSGKEHLQAALLGVFDSQIAGGKRYDLATLGRRRAHATFSESHGIDAAEGLIHGMDLMPLVEDPDLEPATYVEDLIRAFSADVVGRLSRLRAPV